MKEANPYNGWETNPSMYDSGVFFRVAWGEYPCRGAHNGEKHISCLLDRPINPGEKYVEYCGESSPYHARVRRHFECAGTEGLVRKQELNASIQKNEINAVALRAERAQIPTISESKAV